MLNDDRHNDASAPCPHCLGLQRIPLPMTWARTETMRCLCVLAAEQAEPECDEDEPSFDCMPCMGTGEGYAGRRCSSCGGSGLDRRALKMARDEAEVW